MSHTRKEIFPDVLISTKSPFHPFGTGLFTQALGKMFVTTAAENVI